MSVVCMENETFSHQGELVWSIKNFVSKLESHVISLEFSLVPCCKIRLQIRLILPNSKGSTAIVYIDRKDKGPDFVSAEIQCSVLNPAGDNFLFPYNANKDHTLYHKHQVELKSLLPWYLPKYSSDDALILKCQIKLKSCCDVTHFVNAEEYKTNLGLQLPADMISALHRLHTEKPFADCNIKVGETTFPAHKGILCVRAPVFQNYFTHDMREKHTNEIVISDFEPRIVSALLTYLYTNTVEDLTVEEFRQLFAIADKYQVCSLMDKCTTVLLRNLHEESVCKTFKLADMHNNDIMKEAAARFISENFASLRENPDFKDLMESDPRLVLDIVMSNQGQRKNDPELGGRLQVSPQSVSPPSKRFNPTQLSNPGVSSGSAVPNRYGAPNGFGVSNGSGVPNGLVVSNGSRVFNGSVSQYDFGTNNAFHRHLPHELPFEIFKLFLGKQNLKI